MLEPTDLKVLSLIRLGPWQSSHLPPIIDPMNRKTRKKKRINTSPPIYEKGSTAMRGMKVVVRAAIQPAVQIRTRTRTRTRIQAVTILPREASTIPAMRFSSCPAPPFPQSRISSSTKTSARARAWAQPIRPMTHPPTSSPLRTRSPATAPLPVPPST